MTNQKGQRSARAHRFFQVLIFVALANLIYFFIEFSFAHRAESVSLFADSVDFLEDSALNFLILIGIGWHHKAKARLGKALSLLLIAPGLVTLWTLLQKFLNPSVPLAQTLSWVGVGALVVNSICALMLARFRNDKGSLPRAAFLSSRNDLMANVAIILTGFLTTSFSSQWPDFVVGLAIAALNADAAVEVWQEAHKESVRLEP